MAPSLHSTPGSCGTRLVSTSNQRTAPGVSPLMSAASARQCTTCEEARSHKQCVHVCIVAAISLSFLYSICLCRLLCGTARASGWSGSRPWSFLKGIIATSGSPSRKLVMLWLSVRKCSDFVHLLVGWITARHNMTGTSRKAWCELQRGLETLQMQLSSCQALV